MSVMNNWTFLSTSRAREWYVSYSAMIRKPPEFEGRLASFLEVVCKHNGSGARKSSCGCNYISSGQNNDGYKGSLQETTMKTWRVIQSVSPAEESVGLLGSSTNKIERLEIQFFFVFF